MSDRIDADAELYCAGVNSNSTLKALLKLGHINENLRDFAEKAVARYDAAHERLYPKTKEASK